MANKTWNVLVTGGAGYVGSACFRAFRRQGLEAFVLDDLSEGHAAAVEAAVRLGLAAGCQIRQRCRFSSVSLYPGRFTVLLGTARIQGVGFLDFFSAVG